MGEFKRITVTAADEDEVIIAGVDALEPHEGVEVASAAESPAPADPDIVDDVSGEEEAEPRKIPRESPREDGYHETTLDDLKSEPMPTAQKITLIAVAVLLVIAVAYYFAFLR